MLHAIVRLRSWVVGLLSVYLFIYPAALLLVALDQVPVWGTWVGGALLILQGALMGFWLTANYGWRGSLASALILVSSWVVEHTGAITGFPFGTYSYTDVLWPKIAGVVPLAIPFAWLLVVTAAVGATDLTLGKVANGRSAIRRVSITRILTTASFALLLDVTIEPFAVHINNYWVWNYAGGYYDVPTSNFVAWWFTSLLLTWALLVLCRKPKPGHVDQPAAIHQSESAMMMKWLPLALYMLNLTMFVLVNLSHGQGAAAMIGGLILLYLGYVWSEPLLMRWAFGSRRGDGRHSDA